MNTELIIEIFGVLSGILYLILEIKQNKYMWIVGIFTALTYIYVFASNALYAQVLLQIYYLIVSFYGLKEWIKEQKNDVGIYYRKASLKIWITGTIIIFTLFIFLSFILKQFTQDPMPVLDSVSTAISILAMYWLSKSYIEQWLLWIIVNIITIFICIQQQLYLTTLLYSIYAFSALYGFLHWNKKGHFIK